MCGHEPSSSTGSCRFRNSALRGTAPAPVLLSKAYGATMAAVVGVLTELHRQITLLKTQLTELFDQHLHPVRSG
jgi:hypothetical protein